MQFNILSKNNKLPFWFLSNQNGSNPYFNFANFTMLSKNRNYKSFSYNFGIKINLNDKERTLHYENAYFELKNKKLSFKVGRFFSKNGNSIISSGSLVESSNAVPMPRISISIPNFTQVKILNYAFFINGKFELN